MNIPNIPTDNMYKFLSIFGLILFFGSIVISLTASGRIIDTLTTSVKNAQTSQSIEKWVIEDKTNAENTIKDLKNTLKTATIQEKPTIWENIGKEQSVIHEDNTKLQELAKVIYDFNNSGKSAVEWANVEKVYIISFLYTGVIGGPILSFIGFSFWYKKLQKYQDKIIKEKAENKKD